MKLEQILSMVGAEFGRAVEKFPQWPTDPLHAVAVLNEEVGELNKALLQRSYEPNKNVTLDEVQSEAVQVVAMGIRFLLSLEAYDFKRGEQHRQV